MSYYMSQQAFSEYFKRTELRVKKDFERYQRAQAELKNLAPKLAEVHKMLSDIYYSDFRKLFDMDFGCALKGCNERVFFNEKNLLYYPWDESCQVAISSSGNLRLYGNMEGKFYVISDIPDYEIFFCILAHSPGDIISTLEKSVIVFKNFYTEAKKVINKYNKMV